MSFKLTVLVNVNAFEVCHYGEKLVKNSTMVIDFADYIDSSRITLK